MFFLDWVKQPRKTTAGDSRGVTCFLAAQLNAQLSPRLGCLNCLESFVQKETDLVTPNDPIPRQTGGLTVHCSTTIGGKNSTDFNCLWIRALLLRVPSSLTDMGNFMVNPVLDPARLKTWLWLSEARMGVCESRGLRGFSASRKQNDAKKSRRKIRGKRQVILPQGISKGWVAEAHWSFA